MASEKEQKDQKKEKVDKTGERKEEKKEFARPERRLQNVVRFGETNLDGSQKVAQRAPWHNRPFIFHGKSHIRHLGAGSEKDSGAQRA